MTNIEKKALALLNEVWAERGVNVTLDLFSRDSFVISEALCRAIEQHEAFRQEVSDAVRVLDEFITGSEDYKRGSRTEGVHLADGRSVKFARFIIADPEPEPDALREVVNDAWSNTISRLASGEFKVSEAIGTMISGVNFDAMRDALTAELRARGVTAPAPAR